MEFKITASVRIKEHSVFLDNRPLFSESSELPLNEFLKSSYYALDVSWPRFHKMDILSKLGIIGAELLLKDRNIPQDTALVFSNSSSSLGTDKVHQGTINKIVSPSIFVYTLPNIVMGEICIKNKIYGENTFFIIEEFDPQLIAEYSQSLLSSLAASAIVCGWIEWNNDEYDVFLCLVSREGDKVFSAENLTALYNFENE